MISQFHIRTICCFLCFFLAPTISDGATGEVVVDSPVIDGILMVPVGQSNISVSGNYILTEDSTPNFTGATEQCASGIGTFQPDYWEGGAMGGGPMGHYAELSYLIDEGSRRKIGSVRYGHAYRPGTEYDQLNTLLSYSFSVPVSGFQENELHEIIIELVDVYSLFCKPLVWWWMGYEHKLYGEVIASFSIPFSIGEQLQDNPAQDPDLGGCSNKGNQVPID